jgi:hypothetical protein
MRFRAEQFGIGRVRELLKTVLTFELPALVANAGAGRVDLGRFVAVQMIDALVKAPERMLGPRRPVADPGRELKVDGDLDRLIATGLGFDLDALQKRGKEVGLLAALEESAVPVAGRVGGGRIGAPELQAMRSALGAELRRKLDVAAPPKGPGGPGGGLRAAGKAAAGRKVRAAAGAAGTALVPTADALDELIARATTDADDVGAEGGADGREGEGPR